MTNLFSSIDSKRTRNILRVLAHLGSLAPLALIIVDVYTGNVSADPIRELTLRTGKAAITLLVISLAVTPLIIWMGIKELAPLRRIFGLYAFLYVCLHLIIFLWVDYGLNLPLILDALVQNEYTIVGLIAFVILVPLAATSTRWAMKKMGSHWRKLHRWVYLAGVLAVLHYFLLVKNVYTQPILYAVVLAVLLLTRVKPIRQAILRWRRKQKKRTAQPIASE